MERTHDGRHGSDCFGCKVATISWSFPYGGREAFHGPTLKERADASLAESKRKGINAVPVHKPYAGPASI